MVVLIGAALGVYVIKLTPTARQSEAEVRGLVEEFGSRLKYVSLLADRTLVADALQEEYGRYITPALLVSWQNNPASALGRLTSSPWPERIEVRGIERNRADYTVSADVVEVATRSDAAQTNDMSDTTTEVARRPITLVVTNNGSGFRISSVLQHAFPSEGKWMYSASDSSGLQFMYPEKLPTTFISAVDWPPEVIVFGESFTCGATSSPQLSSAPTTTALQRSIGAHIYCVSETSEGAAGSVYRSYSYTTDVADRNINVSFTLKYPQCANYPEPNSGACRAEEATFDVDELADRILQSVRVNE